MPGFLVLHHLPELAQTHVHWVDDAIQPSHPLSPSSPPALSLSQHQGLFQWVALHIMWPKYWSFSFNISPSNEYSGLISFRINWFDLLEVQGILKSILQHHSSKAQPSLWVCTVLQCTAFFMGPALTSIHDHWEKHDFDQTDLCWQSNVSAFYAVSRLVRAFFPKSRCLLILWL